MPDNRSPNILVTRALEKSNQCVEQFKEAGLSAYAFPCIAYEASSVCASQMQSIQLANQYSLIFISPPSVWFFMQQPRAQAVCKNAEAIFAIGKSTAEHLYAFDWIDQIIYPKQANSEQLLKLATLQQVDDKRFFIIRGQQGRELIKNTLTTRGAQVSYVEAYQTQLLQKQSTEALIDVIQRQSIDCIVFTSFNILRHVCSVLSSSQLSLLKQKTITVTNKRMFSWASNHGFDKIILLSAINNESIVTAIANYFKDNSHV